jgi:hypothetical protein
MKKIVSAALLVLAMGGANAQFYVGGALGEALMAVDCRATSGCKDTDIGYKAYVGYTDLANSAMSVEVGYLDFGKTKLSGLGTALSIKNRAYYLAGVLHGNFTSNFGGDGHVGIAYVKTACDAVSETNMRPYVGGSLDYAFTPKLKAVGSLDFTKAECSGQTGALGLLSIGAKYAF